MNKTTEYEDRQSGEKMTAELTPAQEVIREALAEKWSVTMVTSTADPEIVRMCGLIGGDVEMDVLFIHRDGRSMCGCLRGEIYTHGVCEPCYARTCEER